MTEDCDYGTSVRVGVIGTDTESPIAYCSSSHIVVEWFDSGL